MWFWLGIGVLVASLVAWLVWVRCRDRGQPPHVDEYDWQ